VAAVLKASGPGEVRLASLPPLSLYVHIPWCIRKCPYCDFNSHEARDGVPESRYVDALIADLEVAVPLVYGRRVRSVFFGGGTPSLFSPESLSRILSAVRACLSLDTDAEITLEANPGTFEQAKFAQFRAIGINRLSVGVQSFNDAFLTALGRVHGGAEARRALVIAARCFDNFNVDLMYALPGQDMARAVADVREAVDSGASHVSAYHLTIEPNTYFARFPPPLPDDDTAAEMQERIEAMLGEAGFEHYETSAFGRPGLWSRHNLNYWSFGDYLGIGAGAHGKLSFRDRVTRQMRVRHPRDYMERALAGDAVQTAHDVPARELPFEFMMNALRLNHGFALSLFGERTGLQAASVLGTLDRAERAGLLERDLHDVRPTARGRRFLNDLLQMFLPD